MQTDIQQAGEFQQRMFKRIRDDMGKLMTDDELKKIVEASVERSFFEPRVVMRDTGSFHGPKRDEKEPLFLELMREEMRERINALVAPAVTKWVEEHGDEIKAELDKHLGQSFTQIVIGYVNQMAAQPVHALRQELEQKMGLSNLPDQYGG